MRDPNRIEPFLNELGEIWKERYPDWRFGQLMYNFFSSYGDPFYLDEDAFMAAFRAYSKGENPKEAVKRYYEETRNKK